MPLPKEMPKMINGRSKNKDVGRVFANRYRVEKRVGSGSFGTVFLVEDMKAKGDWKVLKQIHVGEMAPDETSDAMREARLLSNLDHPNIVRFMDSFMDGEFFCIVTEYCEGGDLNDKIRAWKKDGKHFEESLIVAWFIQLLLAVQYMHSKRILHRDLKTRNIFLKNNMIKLGDFGISRILMGTSDMATTFTGTPYYMSPEVLKHEAYNAKSDIWSLGVVLYELCNLEHAFQGQNLMGVMYKIVEGSPPELTDGYSSELREIYAQLLEKNPANRPTAALVIKNSYVADTMKRLKIKMNEMQGDPTLSLSKNSRTERKKEKGKLYQEPENRPLTPSQRMMLRKQQKADEEAAKLKQIVAQQAVENRVQSDLHKKKQSRVSLPWVEEHPDVFNDPTFTITVTDASSLSLSPPTSPFAPRDLPHPISGHESDSDVEVGEFSTDVSLSLTGESEIPEDAELAETFYSQFEDEFEDDEDLSSSSGEEDYCALVGHMESALEGSASWESETGTQQEDFPSEGMSNTLRERRINRLRAECEKLLGQKTFECVYKFLQEARFGDVSRDDDSIMDGLGKIVEQPRDCFIVDQLLFMEKQAEIYAMT